MLREVPRDQPELFVHPEILRPTNEISVEVQCLGPPENLIHFQRCSYSTILILEGLEIMETRPLGSSSDLDLDGECLHLLFPDLSFSFHNSRGGRKFGKNYSPKPSVDHGTSLESLKEPLCRYICVLVHMYALLLPCLKYNFS